jgi:siroheme synthase (precorrin-2 oxidase/ferrochelatase)
MVVDGAIVIGRPKDPAIATVHSPGITPDAIQDLRESLEAQLKPKLRAAAEAELRPEIEASLRAQLEAELREKIGTELKQEHQRERGPQRRQLTVRAAGLPGQVVQSGETPVEGI